MLHLMFLLSYTDACADVVAACAWEVVYNPESIGGVTAIALQYADTSGCAAVVRPPLLHVHATYWCAVSSINSKSWLKTQSAKQTATPSVSDMRT